MPTINSVPSASQATTAVVNAVWIKNPWDPTMNYHFYVETDWQEITIHHPSDVQYPLDDDLPVVLLEEVKGDAFNLTFLVLDHEWGDQMNRIIRSNDTLLIQTPRRSWWAVIVGDVSMTEYIWSKQLERVLRKVTINFQQVKEPYVPGL